MTASGRRRGIRPSLAILFLALVIAPSIALVLLSMRSVGLEEASLEKRLEAALQAETDHAASLVAAELDRIGGDLSREAPGTSAAAALAAWKDADPLVAVPFVVSADARILAPSRQYDLSAEAAAFLKWNEDFLVDRLEVPMYENVAVLYQDTILAAQRPRDADAAAGGGAPPAGTSTAHPAAEAARVREAPAAPLPAPAPAPAFKAAKAAVETAEAGAAAPSARKESFGRTAAEAPAAAQQAISEFEQNPQVRSKVIQQATEEGLVPVARNVQPQAGSAADRMREPAPPSILVSSSRRFSQITEGQRSGILPRFVDDGLVLLFWKKGADGGTVGCSIAMEPLKARLLSVLPPLGTQTRILTILDERGNPLWTPGDGKERAWLSPAAAREIHRVLPRWEAAAYPADPARLPNQARQRAALLWAFVMVLFVAIAGGGALIVVSFGREVELARQKTAFVSNVSHELKTPLTSIRMFAEMLRDGRQEDPARRRRYLELMLSESRRLARLVDNVLDFSRMEQGRRRYAMAALDLGALARGFLEENRTRVEEAGFRLVFRAGEGAVVQGDADALLQVLANLLSNAEKYSGGRREIEVEAGRDGRHGAVRVLDRGIGIAARNARRLFTEFYRVDDSLTARVKGTGLGLAIARRIVEDHGGTIDFSPREGGGSVFRFRLPLAENGGAG